MSDHSDMLLRSRSRLRELSGNFITDAMLTREYNVGGREFAAYAKCIRDIMIVKVADTPAVEYRYIEDDTNLFEKVTVFNTLSLSRYKITHARSIEVVALLGRDARNLDEVLVRVSKENLDIKGGTDPDQTREYPEYWHPYIWNEFELRPWFTKGTDADPFYLYFEYFRRWREVDATTNPNNALPDDWNEAPVEFTIWKNALHKREFEVAAEARDTFLSYLSRATGEKWTTDDAGNIRLAAPLRT